MTQIAASGTTLRSSTFLGGSGDDGGQGIAVDDFPQQGTLSGSEAFVVKVAATE